MRQYIRESTFETNSSSMHSLVVVKNPKPYKTYELLSDCAGDKHFDLFWFDKGEYERFPFRVLRTQIDKLRYYVAHYIGYLHKDELIEKVKSFIHEQTGVATSEINIKAYDDCDNEYKGYGYAGMNDTGEDVFTYIEKHNIPMETFVLDPKYVVIVDGDEYQEFKKLFESNILNAEDFEDITSGAHFWNDDILNISILWLDYSFDGGYSISQEIENATSPFVKEVQLEFYAVNEEELKDCFELFDSHYDEIKMFAEVIGKPFGFVCTEEGYELLKQRDYTFASFIDIRESIYSDERKRMYISK